MQLNPDFTSFYLEQAKITYRMGKCKTGVKGEGAKNICFDNRNHGPGTNYEIKWPQ